MPHQLIGPLTAGEIFVLKKDKLKAGQPVYADLKAVAYGEWARKPASLKGPGIYAVFCKGFLIYVGIYTGKRGQTFTGTVLDRWHKHLTYFAMRSPKLAFGPKNLKKILETLDGEPIDALAELVGGRELTLVDLAKTVAPFLRGYSCTHHKARFASQYWELLRPGNEPEMLQEMSFAYARFTDETSALLGPSLGRPDGYKWIKNRWLEPREKILVSRYMPICNKESIEFRSDVRIDEFLPALADLMGTPLEPYVNAPFN